MLEEHEPLNSTIEVIRQHITRHEEMILHLREENAALFQLVAELKAQLSDGES